jgi:hypothetical protein
VDAQRFGLGIGLGALDVIGLAQQGAGQRDEGEALGQVAALMTRLRNSTGPSRAGANTSMRKQ